MWADVPRDPANPEERTPPCNGLGQAESGNGLSELSWWCLAGGRTSRGAAKAQAMAAAIDRFKTGDAGSTSAPCRACPT
ncbi:hypothetical protein GCM10010191_67290 [Actinomadura vinacea]|uniref:DRBM domain-containing protein n=1 Tax=Actinomadura vinacea TaxID=115336 RepID=A0ABP5X0E7_9ACTN